MFLSVVCVLSSCCSTCLVLFIFASFRLIFVKVKRNQNYFSAALLKIIVSSINIPLCIKVKVSLYLKESESYFHPNASEYCIFWNFYHLIFFCIYIVSLIPSTSFCSFHCQIFVLKKSFAKGIGKSSETEFVTFSPKV
jgi:hypothetical protein